MTDAKVIMYCPVCLDCKIYRLLLCTGARPLTMTVQNMTLNNLMVRFQ